MALLSKKEFYSHSSAFVSLTNYMMWYYIVFFYIEIIQFICLFLKVLRYTSLGELFYEIFALIILWIKKSY